MESAQSARAMRSPRRGLHFGRGEPGAETPAIRKQRREGPRSQARARWEARAHERSERLTAPIRAVTLCVAIVAWIVLPHAQGVRSIFVWGLAALAAGRMCMAWILRGLVERHASVFAVIDEALIAGSRTR